MNPLLAAALILTAIPASAKLTGLLSWSWWWIAAPLWLLLAGMLASFVRVMVIANKLK